ncbi:MAG: hypothetical protein EZS28_003557, partial [Streblomastix strix]
MAKILDSEYEDVREKAIKIISDIIEAGKEGLKDGQQHPYRQQLSDDGTIAKLISIFVDKKNHNIEYNLRKTLIYLFKAFPLPSEIRVDLIEYLKVVNDFNDLALLAECL